MQNEGESKIKNILKKLGLAASIVLIFFFILFSLILLTGVDIVFDIVYVLLITFIILLPVIIVTSIVFYKLKQPSMTMRRAVVISLILGFVLAVINSIETAMMVFGRSSFAGFNFTAIGSILYWPLDFLAFQLFYLLLSDDVGDILEIVFFILPLVATFLFATTFSLLVYLNYKHFVRKEKNKNTKYVMIADIFFIGLVLSSLIRFFFISVSVYLR